MERTDRRQNILSSTTPPTISNNNNKQHPHTHTAAKPNTLTACTHIEGQHEEDTVSTQQQNVSLTNIDDWME